jgi:diaminohydroxyphosphoribosylaminopyrimidine deaminase/5-amino-6-(5-phosphoribosylamino)uracil reductase
VQLKAAISRDGFVGPRGAPVRLTGAAADRFLQRQRAAIDAIAVGSGTVLVDDPLLTARGAYRARPLTRVLFDWRARISPDARVFSTLSAGPVIIVVSGDAAAGRGEALSALRGRGIIVQPFDSYDLQAVVAWLGRREIVTLLVEGGPRLQAAFVEAGLVDRVQWVVTPSVLAEGVPLWTPAERLTWSGAPRVRTLGADTLIEVDVHRTD